MRMRGWIFLVAMVLMVCGAGLGWAQEYQYPFQDPKLPVEVRINNILSLMTLDEKIHALSTDPSVPRLGIQGSSHIEGLHGVALGGPGGWEGKGLQPLPTTQFPQSVGLGETWDPELLRQAAAVEGYEARYIFQTDFQYAHGVARSGTPASGDRGARAEYGFSAGSAVGAERGVLWRGSVSYGDDGDGFHKGIAGRQFEILADGGADEAFFGEQQ